MEKNITFKVAMEDIAATHLKADSLRLRQVLINLLGNAANFTPELGEILFRVRQEDRRRGERLISFLVQDNGVGIAEETLKTLFKPFEQGGTDIARAYGGTGLGLSISQSIIRHMGGDIAVTSTPGKGSAFSFSLWLKEAGNNPQQREAPGKSPAALTGKRILLVDDVEINRIIVIEQLSNLGLRMDEAVDGTEAVAMFARSPVNFYDLILAIRRCPDGWSRRSQNHPRHGPPRCPKRADHRPDRQRLWAKTWTWRRADPQRTAILPSRLKTTSSWNCWRSSWPMATANSTGLRHEPRATAAQRKRRLFADGVLMRAEPSTMSHIKLRFLCADRCAEKRGFRLAHAACGGAPDFRPAARTP